MNYGGKYYGFLEHKTFDEKHKIMQNYFLEEINKTLVELLKLLKELNK